MLHLVFEGSPYSLLVILFGLVATAMAVVQSLARTMRLGGLVLGLLAAHLALMIACSMHALSTSFAATAGADAASKATVIAGGVSATGAVLLLGTALGVVASLGAVLGALLAPERRVELAVRAASFAVIFGAMGEMARRLNFTLSVLAASDPEARAAIALAGLGESFAILPVGLALVVLLVIAAGVASRSRPTAA